VLIPFHPRSEMMLDTFDDTVKAISSLDNFKDKIVLIISKYNQCDD
jgi:hypothetical protein